MGVTVRQKVKGKGKPWWVFIAHQGQRKSIKVGDKATAETLAAQARLDLAQGKLNLAKSQVPTFGEYAEKWLRDHGRDLKYSTLKSYESIFKNHLQPLTQRPLDQITRVELKDLLRGKGHLSRATQTRIKALISVILSHALEDELITANPAAGLGRHINRKKDKKADVDPLTCEEAAILLDTLAEHHPRYQPFFLTALLTGLRLGELLALHWGDIDFNGMFIEVRRASFKGRISTPKNHQSRKVDMSDGLAATLRELQTERKKEALAKWGGKIPECVFVNEAGYPIDGDNLRRRVFWKALEKAGLRRIRIHDLRHTFASLLIQNGESLAYVKEQMGHHSISITVDTYGHLVPGANRAAVCKLDQQIGCSGGVKNDTKGQIMPR